VPAPIERIAIDQIAEFDQIIDVRTAAEFVEDHVPGAINCPVLDEAERAHVGTIYKQDSPFVAKRIGAALVARNIAHHLETVFAGKPRQWRPLVYCWRGGKRSAALTHILREVGWDARVLDGGYKAYRRHVVSALPGLTSPLGLRVICGLTGSGKSRLLRALAGLGAQVLDLEALAAHKGSVLGNEPDQPQPSQKLFESRLWQTLRGFDPAREVFVESESKKIGSVRVPDALIQAMWASPCIWLELPAVLRVELLKQEYPHFTGDPAELIEKLHCLKALHGTGVIERWCQLAREGRHDELVAELLETHYDPAYRRSIHEHYPALGQARHCALSGVAAEDFARVADSLAAGHGSDRIMTPGFPPPASSSQR